MDKKEKTYKRIQDEYNIYLKHKRAYIKRGFVCLITLPFLFLIFMFFLDSKVIFLALWIVSFILIAGFLTYQEYLDFYYKKLLYIEEEDNEESSTNISAGHKQIKS